MARLLAVSDLHVGHAANREVALGLRSGNPEDWLVVAGDVGESPEEVGEVLGALCRRFAQVVWVPGNHELWAAPEDPLRGVARYEAYVAVCRSLGVLTPEDPFPVWDGPGGPAIVAPLFCLFDYSWGEDGLGSVAEQLAWSRGLGVRGADELHLHPDPFASREAWCAARVAASERRLAACDPSVPLVLVNHWPLVREPTRVLRHPSFSLWCGTQRTAVWHRRFRTAAAVYGHLHIPRTTVQDGVPFEEVSLGYPREWRARGGPGDPLRVILPRPALSAAGGGEPRGGGAPG